MSDIPHDNGIRSNQLNSKKNLNFKGLESAKEQVVNKAESSGPANVDLRNDPASFLGRSQVNVKKFDPAALAKVEKDLSALKENPQCVALSDKAFDMTFRGAISRGDKDAYAKATNMQVEFVKEFK